MIINLKSIRFGKSQISIIIAHGYCIGLVIFADLDHFVENFGSVRLKPVKAFFHSCSVLSIVMVSLKSASKTISISFAEYFFMPTESVSVCACIKKLRGHWPALCWHREGDSQPCISRKQLLLKCLNGFLSLRLHRFSSTAGGSSSAPSRSPTGRWWPSHRPSRCSRTDGRPPGARPASTPATAAAETAKATLHRCLRMASSDFFWSLC